MALPCMPCSLDVIKGFTQVRIADVTGHPARQGDPEAGAARQMQLLWLQQLLP